MVLREQIHKGCSSFSSVYMRQSPQTDKKCDVHKEILVDGIEYDYGVCRETCGTSNCNIDHEIAVIDRTECYSCSVQKDFMGNIIGQGDGSCWNSPNPDDTEYCTGDQVCLTEMTVEWWSKGEQTVSLQRRCGNKPVGGNWACGVEDMAPYLAKSCNAACEGDLCNDGLDIEDYFAENNVEECFTCTYGEFYNGNALSNSNLYCTNPIADTGTVPTQKCPKYATAACFTAATWHYAANGDELEEDFKGCSAFKLDDDDLQCDNYVINGITYNNCRSTCDEDNCNRITPQKKKSCFTCAATFDAEMNLIGYGESSCFSNNPNPALTQECENEDDYCITDLEADWFLNGRQEYRIRRGCSEKVCLKITHLYRYSSVDNLVISFFTKLTLFTLSRFSLLMRDVWKAQQAMIKCCIKIAQKPAPNHFVTTILILSLKCFRLDVISHVTHVNISNILMELYLATRTVETIQN